MAKFNSQNLKIYENKKVQYLKSVVMILYTVPINSFNSPKNTT